MAGPIVPRERRKMSLVHLKTLESKGTIEKDQKQCHGLVRDVEANTNMTLLKRG